VNRLRRQPEEVRRLGLGGRVLAAAVAQDGTPVAGTREALHIGESRIPWETVEKADWDSDTRTLVVSEVGTWGAPRPVHRVVVAEPGRLLELVRERVTASVVLQRYVTVRGRRGLAVIARRPPGSDEPLTWVYEFDEGVDPDDPEVRELAERTLAQARNDVGLP
jgi:hypothetical protein